MTPAEIVQALAEGKVIDNATGDKFKYEGITIYMDNGTGWKPATLSLAYILQFPNHFRVVTE